jgi:hypothetical protein
MIKEGQVVSFLEKRPKSVSKTSKMRIGTIYCIYKDFVLVLLENTRLVKVRMWEVIEDVQS